MATLAHAGAVFHLYDTLSAVIQALLGDSLLLCSDTSTLFVCYPTFHCYIALISSPLHYGARQFRSQRNLRSDLRIMCSAFYSHALYALK